MLVPPVHCLHALYNPSFMEKILLEFHRASLSWLVMRSLGLISRRTILDGYTRWERGAVWDAEEQVETTISDHQSHHVSDATRMMRFFEHMKNNRSKLRVVHTNGSMSFQKCKEAMRRELDWPLTFLEFWDKAHTKKGTPSTITPAALTIRKL